jgi:hypothetical protein
MAYDILKTKSINVTATFAAKQYTFVKIDTAGQLATPAAGGYAVGVIQDNPIAASPGAVCFPGDITKVHCGGAFNPGDDVGTDGNGYAVAADSGDYVLGVALTTGVNGGLAVIIYQPKASQL